MDLQVAKNNSAIDALRQAKHFELIEGSNYKLTDSFNNEYIIDYGHFEALTSALFSGGSDFITVNRTIISKRYIFKIEPTKEKTEGQKKELDEQAKIQKVSDARKEYLSSIKANFDRQFYDSKYPQGWTRVNIGFRATQHLHTLTQLDIKNCWSAFKTVHPIEAGEIESYK